MCLEMIFVKVFKLFLLYWCIFMTKAMLVQPQLYSSPCPETFLYQRDSNGELYGTIAVFSFDENVVKLIVELSVGNHVGNYNGHIELASSKEQVLENIHNRKSIWYKVSFPRWENIPPRVTKIMVNNQVVCTGPPISKNWINVLTSVTLQHTLTKVTQLSGNPFISGNNNGNLQNPFLLVGGGTNGGKDFQNNFYDAILNQSAENGVKQNQLFEFLTTTTPKSSFLNWFQTTTSRPSRTTTATTTPRITTEKIRKNTVAVNDLLFHENPFFNGKSGTPKIPSRDSSHTVRPPSASGTCGISMGPYPLIVNGNAVPRGAFPWLAAMFAVTSTGLEYKCSGSLVSKKHIVTAAHCVQQGRNKIKPETLIFVLGKINIKKWTLSEGEQMIEASDIQIHPDYVPLTSDADIAVVTLSEEVQFNKYISPICLWFESDDIDAIVGLKGKVIGWGRDEHNTLMTAEPKQANIPIVSQEQCLRSSEAFKYITSKRTFCAGDRSESGPCNGDSGSGFIMKRNGRWALRGVVSISTYDPVKQSCDLSNYVVFTDVSKFKTWLFSIITVI